MMEIPESTTLARQMNEVVQGKKVAALRAGTSPHKFFFTEDGGRDYEKRLKGRAFGAATPLGIYLEAEAEGMSLLIGEGLGLRYFAPGETPPAKYQLYIGLEDGSALYGSVSMYGGAWVHPTGSFENPYYLVAKEKPSPLTAAFDEAHFAAIAAAAKPNTSAKALLATEQRIPGLGNGVLQDILFKAGIHPKRKLSALGDAELEKIFHALKDSLAEMTGLGGRDTEKDLFGQPGGYRTLLSAKTWKSPCPVCGGEIKKEAYLGGSVYYCPTCQPL